jgi:hypothetical protein
MSKVKENDMPNSRLNKLARFLMSALLITSFAVAQGPRNGSVASSHLLIPQGARFLSGGGATANATGIDAIYWNPAGLARAQSNVTAIFARRSYIADISINYIGAGLKLGRLGSLGATIRTFDIGEIEATDIWAPDGNGTIFEPSVFVVGATYSKLMSDRTSIGANVNFINEGFAGVSATGTTIDVGVQYSSFLNIPGLSIGVALRNFGPAMRYGGSALWQSAKVEGTNRETEWYKVEAAAFDMPFTMDIGAAYNLALGASSLDLGFTFENNNAAQDEYRILAQFNLGDMAAVRFGNLTSATIEDDDNTVDIDESALENIFGSYSFGGSLNLAALTGLNLSIDYAFIATEYFDDNQVFALRFGL